MKRNMAVAIVVATTCVFVVAPDLSGQMDNDIRLNVVVGSTGNLRNDGKGAYNTGDDYVAAWLNSTRWPGPWREMSFDICVSWPFARFPGGDSATASPPTGIPGSRTLIHRMTDPVPGGGGQPLGAFGGVPGNDIALSKPLTSTVTGFTDMRIGTSLSPQSAEVRFCDSAACYSLIFGDKSVFNYAMVNGIGTTKPIVSRTSEITWTISFPPRTIARLWSRAGETNEVIRDLGLYYYEGSLQIKKQ